MGKVRITELTFIDFVMLLIDLFTKMFKSTTQVMTYVSQLRFKYREHKACRSTTPWCHAHHDAYDLWNITVKWYLSLPISIHIKRLGTLHFLLGTIIKTLNRQITKLTSCSWATNVDWIKVSPPWDLFPVSTIEFPAQCLIYTSHYCEQILLITANYDIKTPSSA